MNKWLNRSSFNLSTENRKKDNKAAQYRKFFTITNSNY